MILGKVAHQRDRDEVHHDRVDDFVRSETRLEDSGNRAPRRSGGDGRGKAQRHEQRRRKIRKDDPDPGCGKRRDVQLAFRADIEQPCAKCHGDGETRENQRRRQEQRVADPIGPPQGAADQQPVGLNRVVADQQHEHAADDERRRDGDDGKQKIHDVLPSSASQPRPRSPPADRLHQRCVPCE